MEEGASSSSDEAGGYSGAAVAGAALATAFFPFIALIAALLLQGNQSDPTKKSQLRTWAWVSAGWLALVGVILLLLVAVGSSSAPATHPSGPCQGGPKPGAAGRQIAGTRKFVFPCVFGGTETTRLP